MQEGAVIYCGYNFKILPDGSILFDSELDTTNTNLKTGDKFEVIIVPDAGILLKKSK